MKASIVVSLLVGLAAGSYGQLPDPPTPVVTASGSGTWDLSWHAKAGRTFFLQYSENLEDWNYFPVVEFANDDEIVWSFSSTGSEFFLRLKYGDIPSANPETDDFDNDGTSNIDEVTNLGTDPFMWDSDGDGISDTGESDQGYDPNDPSDSPESEALIVTSGLEDVEEVQTRTITIPAGSPPYVVIVAVTSAEFPCWTGGECTDPDGNPYTFNDSVRWSITPSNGSPTTGQADVNSLHSEWLAVDDDDEYYLGNEPVYFAEFKVIQADENQDTTV